jgi:hypothetical protein
LEFLVWIFKRNYTNELSDFQQSYTGRRVMPLWVVIFLDVSLLFVVFFRERGDEGGL